MKSRIARALFALTVLLTTSCDTQKALIGPDLSPQSSVVAPICFGRAATIFPGNPGKGSIVANGAGGWTITGTDRNDVIVGAENDDVILGGAGTDRICAGDGNDLVAGEDGADFLDGELGDDEVTYALSSAGVNVNLATGRGTGGAAEADRYLGIEKVIGSDHNDVLRGDANANSLQGRAGADLLKGGDGIDVLMGGLGADELNGENGNDILDGAQGDDELVGGPDADAINGGLDTDRVNFVASPSGVTVTLADGTGTGGHAGGDTYENVEGIVGSNLVDLLTGNGSANLIDGRGGNDAIHGGGGADELRGSSGDDELNGGADNDLLNGGVGEDVLNGDGGDDRLFGQDDDDELNGGDDNDDLRPGGGVNVVDGGPGTDHLDTTSCADTVTNVETFANQRCAAAGDYATTTVSTAHSALTADGTSTTTITVQVKDAAGNDLTLGGSAVVVSTTAGLLSDGVTQATSLTAIDQNDGTYTLALIASTSVETAIITATLETITVTDDASVDFEAGPVDHFLVTGTDGNPIGTQASGVAFNIKIVAQDAENNIADDFTGTVTLTANPGALALGTSGAFTAGVLASQSVTITGGNDFAITASDGTHTGASASFTVTSMPNAVANEVAGNSAPGDAYHGVYLNDVTIVDGALDLLANDNLGFPAAAVTHFGAIQCNDGAGDLGTENGVVTDNTAGSTLDLAAFAGCGPDATLVVNADGTLTFTASSGYTGLFKFQYRIANSAGTSDGQVTLAVGTRPSAAGSTYPHTLLGNVPINTANSTNFKVTAAGDDINYNIVSVTAGQVVLEASDRTFSFAPNAGYTGPLNFQFSVTNGFGESGVAQVDLTVGTRVWFVDALASAGSGTRSSPFNCLVGATFNCFTNSENEAGDVIYVAGTFSSPGALVLKDGQKVIGRGTAGTFADASGLAWPPDAGVQPVTNSDRPVLSSSSGNVITLASGNTLRGVQLATGTGGVSLFGNNFGTLAHGEVGINSNGQALSLTTGTLAGSFIELSSAGGSNNVLLSGVSTVGTVTLGTAADAVSGASGDGFRITGGNGSFTYPGTVSNASLGDFAVNVNNKTGGAVEFSGNINPVTPARGISLVGNSTGTNRITFSGAQKRISVSTGFGLLINGNTGARVHFTNGGLSLASNANLHVLGAQFTDSLSITGPNNTIAYTGTGTTAIFMNTLGVHPDGITFASIDAGSTTSIGGVQLTTLSGAGTIALGNVTVSGGVIGMSLGTVGVPVTATPTINGVTGAGLFLVSNTGSVTMNAGAIGNTNDPAANAVTISGGNGNVTIAGPITKNTGAGRIVDVTSRTGGTVSIQGVLSCTGNCTGINVASNTGGTVEFTNGTKTLNIPGTQAVTFSSNTGNTTLSFTNGGLAITSGSAAGIFTSNTAPANATLKVQGSSNTIASTTGTPLSVTNTTIGAALNGSEGGLNFQSINATGAVNGILLNNTGSTAGVRVNGTGGNNSGGTIADASGDAVKLTSARDIVLTEMFLSNSGQSHIDAATVTNLTLTNTDTDLSVDHGFFGSSVRNLTISGGLFDRGGLNSSVCNKDGFNITNLLGSSLITGGATFRRSNTRQFYVVNNTATAAGPAEPQDSLWITSSNWNTHGNIALVPLPGTSCSGDHISASSDTNGNFKLIVNNRLSNGVVAGNVVISTGGIGVQATSAGSGFMDARITGLQTSSNTAGVVIASTATGTTVYDVYDNNTANGTGFSSAGSVSVAVTCVTSGSCDGKVRNNTISHTAGAGTDATHVLLEGNGVVRAEVSGNTITGNFQRGIRAASYAGTGSMHIKIDNNTLNQTANAGTGALQGIYPESGGSSGGANSLCLKMLNNSVTTIDTTPYRVRRQATGAYQLDGFTGSGASTTDVQNWITGNGNTYSTAGTPFSIQMTAGPFSTGTCAAPVGL